VCTVLGDLASLQVALRKHCRWSALSKSGTPGEQGQQRPDWQRHSANLDSVFPASAPLVPPSRERQTALFELPNETTRSGPPSRSSEFVCHSLTVIPSFLHYIPIRLLKISLQMSSKDECGWSLGVLEGI
jgi:hypothetical protein